jgi:hypothetical protein
MPEPELKLRVELEGPAITADALAAANVEAECGALLAELGLPGRPRVELRRLPAGMDEALRIYVAGVRCRFPVELPWLAWCYVAGKLLSEATPRQFQAWLADPHPEAFPEWLALCVVEILKRRGGRLLTAEIAAAYLEPAGIKADEANRAVLASVLDQRVSLADREPVEELIREPEAADDIVMRLRPENIEILIPRDYLRRILGDEEEGAFGLLRDWIYEDTGVGVPLIHFVESGELRPESFRFRINSLTTMPYRGLPPGSVMINKTPEPGQPAPLNPASGGRCRLAAGADEAGDAWVWTPLRYLIWWLGVEILDKAARFVDISYLRRRLRALRGRYPNLVEASSQLDSEVNLSVVLRNLVSEGVSVRNLKDILDAILDFDVVRADPRLMVLDDRLSCAEAHDPANPPRDPGHLTEFVRMRMRSQISRSALAGHTVLQVHLLDSDFGQAVAAEAGQDGAEPARERLLAALRRAAAEQPPLAAAAPLLAMADVRRRVRELIADEFPRLAVLTYHELSPDVSVRAIGRIGAAAGQSEAA